MMNNKFTRNLCLFCCVFILALGSHAKVNAIELPAVNPQDPVEVVLTEEWQKYSNTNGVLIEYRMKNFDSRDYGREVNVVVFRFTNTTNESKECSWSLKIERGNKCYNCSNDQDFEDKFNLLLNPNETAEGDMSNLTTRPELNVFGNFVKLVPGMSDEKLTGFELVNLTIK